MKVHKTRPDNWVALCGAFTDIPEQMSVRWKRVTCKKCLKTRRATNAKV
jgi:hypothetical protein